MSPMHHKFTYYNVRYTQMKVIFWSIHQNIDTDIMIENELNYHLCLQNC